jgi:hypothetical protein
MSSDLLDDPAYKRGVVTLLGALAYGEMVSFFAITRDAANAPDLALRVELARFASREFQQYDRLAQRLVELGADPRLAMAPYAPVFDEWHRRTEPRTFTEGLMKVYVGSTIAADFYRECARFVDPQTRQIVDQVLQDVLPVEFAQRELKSALERDPKLAGPLALWGRRMVGEALSQAQRAAAENDDLTALLIADQGSSGFDLGELVRLFGRITDAHTARMEALGLSA